MVQCSVEALGKALYHAFKYPTQPILGLLVGKRLQDNATFVADAVPLTHLLPMVGGHPLVDISVAAVAAYAKTKGLVILGLYVANERLNDNDVSDHTNSMIQTLTHSDKVSTSGAGFVVWQLQNHLLGPKTFLVPPTVASDAKEDEGVVMPMVQYVYSTNGTGSRAPVTFAKWDTNTCTTVAVSAERIGAIIKEGISHFEYCKLVDFEEHLENVALDFFNEKLLTTSSQQ